MIRKISNIFLLFNRNFQNFFCIFLKLYKSFRPFRNLSIKPQYCFAGIFINSYISLQILDIQGQQIRYIQNPQY